MAKKTKEILVAEGKDLNSAIADIRKAPHNFALLLGTEGVFLAAHKTKATTAMKLEAKAAGGNPAKGAVGIVTMDGKTLNFACADGETPPAMLGKKFKAHLKERGLTFKVVILDSKGAVLEGDEEDSTTPPAPSTPDDGVPNDLHTKLSLAYNKIAPGLKLALSQLETSKQAPVLTAVTEFKAAMKDENYEEALKKLAILRGALTGVVEAKPAAPVQTSAGKIDKADLISKASAIDTAITEANKDQDSFVKSAAKLRKFRQILKAAMADGPTTTELAQLDAMKKKLDTLFLNDLKRQGHGPQRHEGDVTPQQLTDRSTKGFDPMSGNAIDAVTGKAHRFNRHASRLLNEGDYVDAEETIRGSKAFIDEQDKRVAAGEKRLVLELPIASVLGPDYANKIQGVTRDGSVKNLRGSHPTNFTGGTVIAIYDIKPDGELVLVTLYPEPSEITEPLPNN